MRTKKKEKKKIEIYINKSFIGSKDTWLWMREMNT